MFNPLMHTLRRLLPLLCLASHAPLALAAAPCPLALDWSAALAGTDVLVLGEYHGTNEMPEAAADAVCASARAGRATVLALEFDLRHEAELRRYLRTPGRAAERRMVERTHWASAHPDGRHSAAMFRLLRTLRGWRQAGWPVDVAAFDSRPLEQHRQYDDRRAEAGMAAALAADIDAAGTARVIVLVGNLHARSQRDTVAFKPEPMTWQLRQARPALRLRSLLLLADAGEMYVCHGPAEADCGVRFQKFQPLGGQRRVVLDPAAKVAAWMGGDLAWLGHDGYVYVGPMTPSRPFGRSAP